MKITDLLVKENIKLELKSISKEKVLHELAGILHENGFLNDLEKFTNAVFEREEKFSTGIGHGIAIPHAKTDAVNEPSIVFAKSIKGIDFNSSDGKLANLFFLIAVPEDSSNEHLKILSQLSRKLMHDDLRKALIESKTESEVLKVLS